MSVLKPLYKNISGRTNKPLDKDDVVRDGEKPIGVGRKEITSDYTVEEHVSLVAVGSISSPLTITIPSDQNYLGRVIVVQDEQGNASSHNITIETEGSETLNGGSDWILLNNYQRETIYSNGNNWLV